MPIYFDLYFTKITDLIIFFQNSAYKKVEPSKEINPTERDKFWALEEEQEKQRQLEEARRRQEELIRLEEERIKREVS